MINQFQNIIVVVGHYGSGKTNLSLNLARYARAQKKSVVLADLDTINPYFRTSDFRAFAQQHEIALVCSDYAGSTLDLPALSAKLDAHIGGRQTLIIDAGGDDAGTHVLGRYAPLLQQAGYTMLYVVNAYRYLTQTPEESVSLLREIERASRLNATHIVNCSNLGPQTTAQEVRASQPYAAQVAKATQLPVAFTAVRKPLADELTDMAHLFPVEVYVTAPWNETPNESETR